MTDAAIALFERLTGRLFTRSRNSQDRSWSASKTQAGRLIRLFGGTIDAMVRAREDDRDPFDVLDEEIGWERSPVRHRRGRGPGSARGRGGLRSAGPAALLDDGAQRGVGRAGGGGAGQVPL